MLSSIKTSQSRRRTVFARVCHDKVADPHDTARALVAAALPARDVTRHQHEHSSVARGRRQSTRLETVAAADLVLRSVAAAHFGFSPVIGQPFALVETAGVRLVARTLQRPFLVPI